MTMTIPDPLPPTSDQPGAPRASVGSGVVRGVAVRWGAASRRGAARADNQDDHLGLPPVFAVADGMGGHAAGGAASRCVTDALCTLADVNEVTAANVNACLAKSRAAIGAIAFESGAPPGSTVSGAIVTRDPRGRPCWMVFNVGDSRTYRWDGRELTQLTVDHTVAAELVQYGALPASSSRSTPFGHLLTRAVLAATAHRPDIGLAPLAIGDRMLVCSDGLHGTLDDTTIAGVLRSVADPQEAARALIDRVSDATGRDDATALVVDAVSIECRCLRTHHQHWR
jgi:PPM family protein phosphatase